MAYNIAWGEPHPGLLIYLVDLSGSMGFYDKHHRVSNTIWKVTDSLVASCQDDGIYKERFHLEVIGYNQKTYNIFSGGVNDINKVLDLHEKDQLFFELSEEDNKPKGLTHMAMAFAKAAEIINTWKKKQEFARKPMPAPIVINITDGFPEEAGMNESDARAKALNAANTLKNIEVPDGNVLLFNVHIDGEAGKEKPLYFMNALTGDIRKDFLYNSASLMLPDFIKRAQRAGMPAKDGSHFAVSNISDPDELASLIAFGSSVSSKMNVQYETPF